MTTIARVQGGSTGPLGFSTSVALTLPAPVGVGNCLCGLLTWDTGTVASLTDNKGNTYNLEATSTDSNGVHVAAFSRTNITNGPQTLTATFSTSAAGRMLAADEFSGTSTASSDERDGTAHGGLSQSTGTSATDGTASGPFTTAKDGDLIYGACETTETTTFCSPGTGFTGGITNNVNCTIQTEYRVQPLASSGTQATFTQLTTKRRVIFLVTIKAAAYGLIAAPLTVASPVLGTPAYSKNAYALTAISVGHSPIIGAPVLKQKQVLVAAGLTVQSPVIQVPGRLDIPVANLTVGSPVLATPVLHHPQGAWSPIPTHSQQLAEAVGVLNRALDALVAAVPGRTVGRLAWDFRHAVGVIRADAQTLINDGSLGPKATEAWELARKAGASFYSLMTARSLMIAETPMFVPAEAVSHLTVQLTLIQMATICGLTTYDSRDEALIALNLIAVVFGEAEEDVADEHDASMYRSLVTLRAATVRDLAERCRQLPRVVPYSYPSSMPGLWIAHKIYQDGARSEQLLKENKWVHPLFATPDGVALSR